MKNVIAAAAVALSLADGAPASAAQAEGELQITRAGARPVATAPAQNFTGAVKVEMLYLPMGEERASAGTVRFSPGARTHWHSHPLGQTLVVTAGIGRVQRWGGPVEEIRVGDVVHIPANVKHWHGAAADTAMTNIAITEALNGSAAQWLEPVSDNQYAVAPAPVTQPGPTTPGSGQKLMADIAPALGQLTDEVLFGQVWSRPGLSQRDRSLITVSALMAMNRPDQLRGHLALARRNGVTDAELIEAITQLAFYAGWPSGVTAVGVAREVFKDPLP